LGNSKPLQQLSIIPPVKDFEVHCRIKLSQLPDLSILLGHEVLLERGQLDIKVELREIEIGGEAFGDFPAAVPIDRKASRLVLPFDLIEVQDPGELFLTRVGKGGTIGGGPSLEGRTLLGFVEDLSKPIEQVLTGLF